MIFVERARAKINLTLHIRRRRSDGWHELESLVAFAAIADQLQLDMGGSFGLTISGPRAAGLSDGDDNLIMRAALALSRSLPQIKRGAFHLIKNLPSAAGIGGGSADAAAALRLLARANDLPLDHPILSAVGQTIGADVPVCLPSRAAVMRGVGEDLTLLAHWPALYCVLVNPAVAVDTGAVFARMNLPRGAVLTTTDHPAIADGLSTRALIDAIARGRNDMEDAAQVLAPSICDVLAAVAAARGCQLARMSGSGATCFGLFLSRQQARIAARTIARAHPQWWVKASLLR